MKKKTFMLIAAFALVLCLAVGGTLAYFTDITRDADNTFTIGKVDIELDESSEADEEKGWKSGEALEEGLGFDYINCMPGSTYAKAPVVTIADDSQPAYVFVEIQVGGADKLNEMIAAANKDEYKEAPLATDALDENFLEGSVLGDYRIISAWDERGTLHLVYSLGIMDPAGENLKEIKLFDAVKVPELLDASLAQLQGATITMNFEARAAQAENLDEAKAFELLYPGQTMIPEVTEE